MARSANIIRKQAIISKIVSIGLYFLVFIYATMI